MAIQVIEDAGVVLEEYATVPIGFTVRSRFLAKAGKTDFVLEEQPVHPPYEYDYDQFDAPASWRQWDLRAWGFLAAMDGTTRVGGAAIAFRTPGLELLEGRDDLVALWDIRVRPESRGRGAGALLFEAAKSWARQRGATRMKVETQDINVPACRFYAKRGCRLDEAHAGIYERHPRQVQLLWSLALA